MINPKKPVINGSASIIEACIQVKVLWREQLQPAITWLIERDFTFEWEVLRNGRTEYVLTVNPMHWAHNVAEFSAILEQCDYNADEEVEEENSVDDQMRNILKQLFRRYMEMVDSNALAFRNLPNKCDTASLENLCQEAIKNMEKYPLDKMNRWLGFVQGVLATQGVITVDGERDFTRPLFNSINVSPSWPPE